MPKGPLALSPAYIEAFRVALAAEANTGGLAGASLVTNRAPAFAGIDPYNEWIDRNSDNNVTKVSAAGGG